MVGYFCPGAGGNIGNLFFFCLYTTKQSFSTSTDIEIKRGSATCCCRFRSQTKSQRPICEFLLKNIVSEIEMTVEISFVSDQGLRISIRAENKKINEVQVQFLTA